MRPIHPLRLALAVLLVPAALGVACATTGINKGQLDLIGYDDEAKMGAQFQAEVAKQQKILDDPASTQWLAAVGAKLLAAVPKDEIHFKFTFQIVDTQDINAFAVPGGHFFCNKGLIQLADNESEVAAVMAHEISHVLARHGTETMTKQYGVAAVEELVLGENPAAWQKVVADSAIGAGFLKNSRSQEDEADRLGLRWLAGAGYEPEAMAKFFEKLQAAVGADPNGGLARSVQRFMSDHPLTSDRIRATRERIAAMPQKPAHPVVDTPQFQQVRARLGGAWKPPKAA